MLVADETPLMRRKRDKGTDSRSERERNSGPENSTPVEEDPLPLPSEPPSTLRVVVLRPIGKGRININTSRIVVTLLNPTGRLNLKGRCMLIVCNT